MRNNLDMQDQHKIQHMGCGKVTRVKMLKTSEEVKRARVQERKRQKYLAMQQAMQQAMLQAVEQAVALPEPIAHTPCEQVAEQTSAQQTADTKTTRSTIGQSLRGIMKGAQESVTSIFNRMYTVVMEEG